MRLVLILAALYLPACEQESQWKGWVCPNRNNLAISIPIGPFMTIEECRDHATAKLSELAYAREPGDEIAGDYECGYRCEPDGGLGGLDVCEKTER